MGSINKQLVLLLTVLGVLFVKSIFADTTGAWANPGQKPFALLTEQEFHQLLDKVSQEKLQLAYSAIATVEGMNQWERARQAVITSFTSHFSLEKFKKLVATQGMTVASIIVVGEIVSDVILPPVFLFFNAPWLALATAVTPSTAYLLPTYFYFVQKKANADLAASMGMSVAQLQQLNRLKTTILEYSAEKKLFSLVLQTLGQRPEMALVKRSWYERWTSRDKGAQSNKVYLDELEQIFINNFPNKKNYLGIFAAAADGSDEVYGALLINYLQTSPAAVGEVQKLLGARVNSTVAAEVNLLKKYLKIIEDRRKSIEFRQKEFGKTAAGDLLKLGEKIRQFEYRFLLFAQQQLQDPQEFAPQLEHFFREWQSYDNQYQTIVAELKWQRSSPVTGCVAWANALVK